MKLDASAFVGGQTLVTALKDHATPIDCNGGRELFRQDECSNGIYIVLDGDVSLTMRSPDGDLVMDHLPALPGSLLGLPALVGGEGYSLSATAQKGAHVSFVSADEFSRLMLQEPTIAVMILKVLAAEVRTARLAAANA